MRAVANNYDCIRLKIGELRPKVRIILDGFGLSNGQSEFCRRLLHRRRDEFKAATFCSIRLRHHQANHKSTRDQPL